MSKYIKIYIIISFLMVFSYSLSFSSQYLWKVLLLRNENFSSIDCPDSNNCIATTQFSGYSWIVRTTNGGKSWINSEELGKAKFNFNLSSVSFKNKDLCIIGGDSAHILRSTDQGENWEKFQLNDSGEVENLFMYNINLGCLTIRARDKSYITKDGGKTWSKIIYPDSLKFEHIDNISIPDSNTIILISNNSKARYSLIRTDDLGKTWARFTINTGSQSLYFFDNLNGWLAGAGKEGSYFYGYIYQTTDGGITWNLKLEKHNNTFFYQIQFLDKNYGLVIGGQKLILRTTDGGITWLKDSIDTQNQYPAYIYRACILSPTCAYAIGSTRILKYTNEIFDVDENIAQQPGFEIYPNPCFSGRDVVFIRNLYGLSIKEIVVYNSLSEIVYRQAYENSAAAEEEIALPAINTMASGVYWVRIVTEKGSVTKAMVLLE